MTISVNVHGISYLRATFAKDGVEGRKATWLSIIACDSDHDEILEFTCFMKDPARAEALANAINALAPKEEPLFQ